MKRTYYFDNSRMIFCGELIVICEAAFKAMKKDYTQTDRMHQWVSGKFNNINEAKEYFATKWEEIKKEG